MAAYDLLQEVQEIKIYTTYKGYMAAYDLLQEVPEIKIYTTYKRVHGSLRSITGSTRNKDIYDL